MEIVIVGLGFMFALWIAVIWGSNLFNKNMQ
jgi:formate/nitrite transporter FocA (FNT family)